MAMPRGPITTTLLAAMLLAGCAEQTMSPTAVVMPAPGKPFEVFSGEQSTCRQFAGNEVSGAATMAGLTELGTVALGVGLGVGVGSEQRWPRARRYDEMAGTMGGVALASHYGANAQTGLQARYNLAYVQCMVAHGNQIPTQTGATRVARNTGHHVASAAPGPDSDDQPVAQGGYPMPPHASR
jgi:hypothetical protein